MADKNNIDISNISNADIVRVIMNTANLEGTKHELDEQNQKLAVELNIDEEALKMLKTNISNFKIEPARKSPYSRVLFMGTPGAGKTYSALRMAKLLEEKDKFTCYIDLNNMNISNMITKLKLKAEIINVNYATNPVLLTKLLIAIQATNRYNTIIIDNITHLWNGIGSVLANSSKMYYDAQLNSNSLSNLNSYNFFNINLNHQNIFLKLLKSLNINVICTCLLRSENDASSSKALITDFPLQDQNIESNFHTSFRLFSKSENKESNNNEIEEFLSKNIDINNENKRQFNNLLNKSNAPYAVSYNDKTGIYNRLKNQALYKAYSEHNLHLNAFNGININTIINYYVKYLKNINNENSEDINEYINDDINKETSESLNINKENTVPTEKKQRGRPKIIRPVNTEPVVVKQRGRPKKIQTNNPETAENVKATEELPTENRLRKNPDNIENKTIEPITTETKPIENNEINTHNIDDQVIDKMIADDNKVQSPQELSTEHDIVVEEIIKEDIIPGYIPTDKDELIQKHHEAQDKIQKLVERVAFKKIDDKYFSGSNDINKSIDNKNLVFKKLKPDNSID